MKTISNIQLAILLLQMWKYIKEDEYNINDPKDMQYFYSHGCSNQDLDWILHNTNTTYTLEDAYCYVDCISRYSITDEKRNAKVRELFERIQNKENNMSHKNKLQIIASYTISGVPVSSLPNLCKDLNINQDKLNEYLQGQTVMAIGNEAIIFATDIEKFVAGIENTD
jgi:hypothetical protein